ncbi:MAG: guanylate kinase [Deltaproteobacteria bacterium CG11_big_fil_rev_8_21_14_0_20_49_13]|nr:MAG: guanylate kinase [Deltaproteobacteria bacterium CG11_big_fil_rev_8_21_14_0_20_49_13]
MTGKLFVISAPSGAGKTTIIKRLISLEPALKLSVSATTRSPRVNEKDGVDYLFVTKEEFLKMKDAGELVEWALVHDTYYGTPKEQINKWLEEGKKVILDIDVQGAASVKKIFKDAVTIFVLPPSHDELVKRLKGRGTDTEEVLAKRIANAKREMKKKDEYDIQIVNDDVEDAVKRIRDILDAKA